MTAGKVSPLVRWWSALLVLATALPVLFLNIPPMADVLGHIGRYAIQTGLDQHPVLKSYFSFEWHVIGNLGADLLVEVLAPITGVERATVVAVALVPLFTASGILLLSRRIHGRITPFAILALALIYSVPFNWGFLNFSLSMGLALLAFNFWLLLADLKRLRLRAALFVPIACGLWLCHTFGWGLLGILCTADSLARSLKAGRTWPQALWDTLLRCLPLAAPLVPTLAWRSSAAAASGTTGWFNPLAKVAWMVAILRLEGEVIDKVSAFVLLIAVYAGLRSPRIAIDRTMATSALIAFVGYMALPAEVFQSLYADMRLAPYVVMLALLAMRETGTDTRRRAMWMMAALVFLGFRLAYTGIVFKQRENALEKQMEALQVIPEGSRLATLFLRPCEAAWELPWLSHAGSVAIARRHVFANDQWSKAGVNLMTVHYPAAGAFATDAAEIVYAPECGNTPTLAGALARLPVQAFTHVWVLGARRDDIPRRRDLVPVWQGQDATVFEVVSPHSGTID